MSVQEVENMTLAQKRMAAMVMETAADDIEAHREKQAAAEAEAAAAVSTAGIPAPAPAPRTEEQMAMDQDDEDDLDRHIREEEERQKEIERAQTNAIGTSGPMKIRTDYIPKRESIFMLRLPH